jgi:hypothetical protein
VLALIAVGFAGLAVLLDLIDEAIGDFGPLTALYCSVGFLAAHAAVGGGPWRRRP